MKLFEGERIQPRTETPYTLTMAFATKKERAAAKSLAEAAPVLLDAMRYILPSIAVPKAYERAVAAIARAEGRK